MTLLLQHLDQNRPASIKKQVTLIMVEFFRESTGHFIQILDALARHLVASVEVCYFGLKEKRSGKFSGLGY